MAGSRALSGQPAPLASWLRARNRASLARCGQPERRFSDSLENFKAIVAYHRRDYFRERFAQANAQNYQRALAAGLSNQLFVPCYALCNNLAQLAVVIYGLTLVSHGDIAVGLLISFLTYITRFYDPLRQMAALSAGFQTAMAGWERISAILKLQSNLDQIEDNSPPSTTVMEFQSVDFGYEPGRPILNQVELQLEAGKTYALVGPTGRGEKPPPPP